MSNKDKRIGELCELLEGLRATPQPRGKYAAEVKFSLEGGICNLVEYWSDFKEGVLVLTTVVTPISVAVFSRADGLRYVENRLHAEYLAAGNYILTRDKEYLARIDRMIADYRAT